MLTGMWPLEEGKCEGSCSSVVSFEEWCRSQENEQGASQTQCQTKQRPPAWTGILGFLGRRFLDSFDAEPDINLSCPKTSCLEGVNSGRRVRDSFASLGSGDSSRSIHGGMSKCNENEKEEEWIKVDLIVTDAVEMGLTFLTGKMKHLYLMERARDAQFLLRYDGPSPNKTKRHNGKTPIKSQNHVPTHHEDADNGHFCPTRRRRLGEDANVPGFVKSLSMTALAMSGAFEPMDVVKEEADGYNVDGHCLQHIVVKSLSAEPSPAEYRCGRPRENPLNQGWPSTTPKIKKGLHQSIKAKWQPVSRALSRCYSWDGCSSTDCSSRYGISMPCRFIKDSSAAHPTSVQMMTTFWVIDLSVEGGMPPGPRE